MKKNLKNITIALFISNVFSVPLIFAASSSELQQTQPIPKKSFGTFIAGIADETTHILQENDPNKPLYASSFLPLVQKMVYATLYGMEVERDHSNGGLKIVGSFAMDSSGSRTNVTDTRIQNIFKVCKNIALYIKNTSVYPFLLQDINRILSMFSKTPEHYISSPKIELDLQETEFSYLQRMMLARITFGYITKLTSFDITQNSADKFKSALAKIALPASATETTFEQYWQKTEVATNVAYAVIKPDYRTKEVKLAALENFKDSTINEYPALKAWNNKAKLDSYEFAKAVTYANIKGVSEQAATLLGIDADLARPLPEYSSPISIEGITDREYLNQQVLNEVTSPYVFLSVPELQSSTANLCRIANRNIAAYNEILRRAEMPVTQLFLRMSKVNLAKIKAAAEDYEAQLAFVKENQDELKRVLVHSVLRDEYDSMLAAINRGERPDVDRVVFYLTRIFNEDEIANSDESKLRLQQYAAIKLLKKINEIEALKSYNNLSSYLMFNPNTSSFMHQQKQKLDASRTPGGPAYEGPLAPELIDAICASRAAATDVHSWWNKPEAQDLITQALDQLEVYYAPKE